MPVSSLLNSHILKMKDEGECSLMDATQWTETHRVNGGLYKHPDQSSYGDKKHPFSPTFVQFNLWHMHAAHMPTHM